MAWFPADPNWNDFYLPPGIQQDLSDLETIFREMPPFVNQNHAQSSYSLSHAPKVEVKTPDPHSLIAPPTHHISGLGNQAMMSLDSPLSNTYQPQGMAPVLAAQQPIEPLVNPKTTPATRKPRIQRTSLQSQHNSTAALRCGWKDCKYSGTFARKAELMRHIDLLHVSPHSYDCPVRGCRKVCNRKDNLLEHIRRAHYIEG